MSKKAAQCHIGEDLKDADFKRENQKRRRH